MLTLSEDYEKLDPVVLSKFCKELVDRVISPTNPPKTEDDVALKLEAIEGLLKLWELQLTSHDFLRKFSHRLLPCLSHSHAGVRLTYTEYVSRIFSG